MENVIDELVRKIKLLEEELEKEKELNREVLRELAIIKDVALIGSEIYKTSKKITFLSKSLKAGTLAKEITETLLSEGPLNISQLTNLLRRIRGKASRKTVAKKLEELEKLGLVETVEGKKSEKLFKIKE